ncbi:MULTISPECIES: hypothetical protein [unclassified Nitratiruptor]|uniref:hypothetical protein n=1 Tax=unclassified Nitratiruptor TaxID=2624044 RepID=UPI001914DD40|nr:MULTISPECIES: hypothetical protein [unclassified Nitratiruptor]BCD59877.1 hypothetical protein NitYY0810_C0636 [Nitratiruptor sp. YY08-10]BCD63800.1 hypothetical protein NitYY0814_C0635 [Nitratiruptor sp. YY08-14]
MNSADIHGKKLIAVAGKDVFGKQFISVVNKEIADKNLFMIGININEEDFSFFIHNLKDSKVEVTIFMPEFQKKSAEFFGLDGYLLMSYKENGALKFVTAPNETLIDDQKLLKLSKQL